MKPLDIVVMKPLDIVVIEGRWWNPVEAVIMWRSLSKDTHCFVIRDPLGRIFDPTIGGVLDSHISKYKGRKFNLLRYKEEIDVDRLMAWAIEKQKLSKQYDYLSWLGFATGIKALQDEDNWYCSEFCYWMFQENGYLLTNEDLTFVYPSDLSRNKKFGIVKKGVL